MLNVVKIDSLKLRIPRYKVKYIDPTFAQEYQKMFSDTGLLEEHINLDKHKVNVTNGISTRIAVFHSLEGQMTEEQIIIQCNAKQARENYFMGINAETLKEVYQYIMDLNIIYVDYETFLDSYVSDIDICYDVNVTQQAMIEANREIYRNVKTDKYKYVSNPFSKKHNTGLQFNTREKATPAKPFCKIYHKTIELLYNSSEFAEEYLKDLEFSDIGRLEYCIKNTKHKKHLGLEFKTLRNLLNIESITLENIVFSGVLCYIEKKTILRDYKDLTPTDRILVYFIDRLISKGDDKQNIYSIIYQFENPQERSRMKKKITGLLENVEDKKRLLANKETLDFLRVLKLDF